MSDEPEHKRSRLDNSPGDLKDSGDMTEELEALNKMVQENLEALDRVQTDLNDVNEKASAEIIQIEKKYNELRKPFFEKRQKCIETIPNFWLTVFITHPATRAILDENEEEAFHYCTNFQVAEEFTDTTSTYSLIFTFDVNPFFENTELVKKFTMPIAGEVETTCISTQIIWKADKKLPGSPHNQELGSRSFFEWFSDTTDPGADEIAEIIKEDIWLNPLQYYIMQDDSSFDGSDDDDIVGSDDADDVNDSNDLNE